MPEFEKECAAARTATGGELDTMIYHPAPQVLLALLENPVLDEEKLRLLLTRKDLPAEVLAEIGSRKELLKNHSVKRALLFHVHTPRLVGLRLLKSMYLMDLVQFALLPSAAIDLRRNAEEQIIARLSQLPLGQKITLARRAPARVAGALIREGHPQVLAIVLDSPYLNEAQVLKALAGENIRAHVVQAVANHRKWSQSYNVRLALVRNASAPLATVLAFLPEITVSDLRDLAAPGVVPENLRNYLQAEIQRRMRAARDSSEN